MKSELQENLSIERMKEILSKQMSDLYSTNTNLADAIHSDFKPSNIEDGMVTYSVVGFEVSVFVDVGTAISSAYFNEKISNQINQYDIEEDSDEVIIYSVEVLTKGEPTMVASVALDSRIILAEEKVKAASEQEFADQCAAFIAML